ncbi:hypothetical protein CDAR_482511 [Caerostris darwini]|uniref:Uncharacterized protein n=1 Tax=Caerostris darwini TaxID=1538125 RepID=A0AAV4N593_9ARAC|nr:hypothetical protein CDAR_482511 [Caerostris darwini]
MDMALMNCAEITILSAVYLICVLVSMGFGGAEMFPINCPHFHTLKARLANGFEVTKGVEGCGGHLSWKGEGQLSLSNGVICTCEWACRQQDGLQLKAEELINHGPLTNRGSKVPCLRCSKA